MKPSIFHFAWVRAVIQFTFYVTGQTDLTIIDTGWLCLIFWCASLLYEVRFVKTLSFFSNKEKIGGCQDAVTDNEHVLQIKQTDDCDDRMKKITSYLDRLQINIVQKSERNKNGRRLRFCELWIITNLLYMHLVLLHELLWFYFR